MFQYCNSFYCWNKLQVNQTIAAKFNAELGQSSLSWFEIVSMINQSARDYIKRRRSTQKTADWFVTETEKLCHLFHPDSRWYLSIKYLNQSLYEPWRVAIPILFRNPTRNSIRKNEILIGYFSSSFPDEVLTWIQYDIPSRKILDPIQIKHSDELLILPH